jgi:pimeloyl-ACP methyl ester carboxylesterase
MQAEDGSMIARYKLVQVLALILGLAAAALPARVLAQQSDPAVAELGAGFISATAEVNGTRLHYVRGGAGPAVVLLHGFPQDWYEFHRIMPRLAGTFTVVAVDLRGIGGSQATPGGYEAANLAEDIHQLVQQLALAPVYVVGHDMGGIVAYAYARLYAGELRGAMLLDVPLPGIAPWDEVTADPMLWHINFHQTPELPEKLIAGRQDIYFRYFYTLGTVDHAAITEADAAHYVRSHAAADQLRAAFEMYRALPANAAFNAAQRGATDLPLVLAGGDRSFGPLLPTVAEQLRTLGWSSVTVELIENSAHYVADESPDAVAALIERHASR